MRIRMPVGTGAVWWGGLIAALVLVLCGLTPAIAHAAPAAPRTATPAPDPPPQSAEEFFVRLFLVTCLTNIRDPRQVVALAQASGMPPIGKPYVQMFLDGKDGAAWSASNKRWGKYILSLREDGRCGVYAQRLDAGKVGTLLRERVISGIAEQYTVETLPVQTAAGARLEAYLAGTGVRDERLRIEVTTAPQNAHFVSILKAQLVRRQ